MKQQLLHYQRKEQAEASKRDEPPECSNRQRRMTAPQYRSLFRPAPPAQERPIADDVESKGKEAEVEEEEPEEEEDPEEREWYSDDNADKEESKEKEPMIDDDEEEEPEEEEWLSSGASTSDQWF